MLTLSNSKKVIKVSFLVIACKDEKNEFPLPMFSVYAGQEYKLKYVDSQCRTYESWHDWKSDNNLPEMKYAYPKDGYLTCQIGKYAFDETKDPLVGFGDSPASGTLHKVGKGADITAGITSLVCGGIGIASMFTPIGPAVLLASGKVFNKSQIEV